MLKSRDTEQGFSTGSQSMFEARPCHLILDICTIPRPHSQVRDFPPCGCSTRSRVLRIPGRSFLRRRFRLHPSARSSTRPTAQRAFFLGDGGGTSVYTPLLQLATTIYLTTSALSTPTSAPHDCAIFVIQQPVGRSEIADKICLHFSLRAYLARYIPFHPAHCRSTTIARFSLRGLDR